MRTLGTLVSFRRADPGSAGDRPRDVHERGFEHCFQRVYESIREGDTIAQPLKESRLVDDMVVNMIDVGEETGDLDTMLYKVADVYDEEVDVLVESLISLLEPIMIVVLGLHRRHHRHRAVHAADRSAGRPGRRQEEVNIFV